MTRILCSRLVATLPFGSVLADTPVLVEWGPGGYSPGHAPPKSAFIYARP